MGILSSLQKKKDEDEKTTARSVSTNRKETPTTTEASTSAKSTTPAQSSSGGSILHRMQEEKGVSQNTITAQTGTSSGMRSIADSQNGGTIWGEPTTSRRELRQRAEQTENPLARVAGAGVASGAAGWLAGLAGAVGTGAKGVGVAIEGLSDQTLLGAESELASEMGAARRALRSGNVQEAQAHTDNISALRANLDTARADAEQRILQDDSRVTTRIANGADSLYEGIAGLRDQMMQEAQAGQDIVGQRAAEVFSTGTQMGLDALGSILVPGSGLGVMGARSFGDASQAARQQGASVGEQIAYGATVGGVEMFTERMFDGLAGIYGKGSADEIVEKAINKLAKSTGGRAALNMIASMGGEAAEEVVSGIIDPALESIYNNRNARENYTSDTISDILHDAIIGGLLGMFGGAADLAIKGVGAEEAPQAPTPQAPAEQVAQFASTLGKAGQTVLTSMYNAENSTDYIQGMTAAYNMGKGTVTGEKVEPGDAARVSMAKLNSAQSEAAFRAGIADGESEMGIAEPSGKAYNGIENNKGGMTNVGEQGRDDRYGEGSLRSESLYAGERVGGVDEEAEGAGSHYDQRGVAGTAQRENQIQTFSPRAGKDAGAASLGYGKEVSAADFSIPGANAEKTVRLVESGSTQSLDNARAIAGDSEVVAYGGGYLSAQGNDSIEAWSQPQQNRMGVAVDDPNFTADQFAGHEKCEILIGQGKVSVEDAVKLANLPEGALDEALDIYEYIYEGESRESLLKELVCDAAGNMNRMAAYGDLAMAETAEAAKALDTVLSAIHDALEGQTNNAFARVPKGGTAFSSASRSERPERRRALRPGEMVNEFRDKVNWPEYYRKIISEEYNPEHFEDGETAFIHVGGQLLRIEMQPNGEWSVKEIVNGKNLSANGQNDAGKGVSGKRTGDGDRDGRSVKKPGKDTGKGAGTSEAESDGAGDGQGAAADHSRGLTPEQDKALTDVGVNYDAESESANPTEFSRATWLASDYTKDKKKAAEDLSKALGCSVRTATKFINDVNSIAKTIADDRVRLDYEAAPGMSSFVSNAEYGGSIDFSTICKKRRVLTGTIEAIQKAMPDGVLTADEILKIRDMMKQRGYEVSCGLCYVEGSRAKMGEYAQEFIKLYKKYYPDAKWTPTMYNVATPTGAEEMRTQHPEAYKEYEYFWNHYGTLRKGNPNLFASQQKPKLYQSATEYNGEILKKFKSDSTVAEKNKNGGLRLQSFSDFEIIHLIDTMQVIMDMSRVGLAGQAYTKVPDFAWAVGSTGLKVNCSLIAKGVDKNGRIIVDEVEGMPRADAEALRNAYSKNVGTILVVFNDEQLQAAMNDPFIDFIIPFHRSQWAKKYYEILGLPAGVKDYTNFQNEKMLGEGKGGNLMPNEYWDFSKSGKANAEKYLELCAKDGKRPKFYNLLVDNGDGSYSLQPDGSTDGYWKLLIDFKMYDNNGKGSPQMPVKPTFNMEEAERMLREYKGGHQQFPVAQDVVDDFLNKTEFSTAPARKLYRTEYDFTKPMPSDEFRELIRDEAKAESYMPKGLSPEFVKAISRKSLFNRTKLYRGIDAAEFDFLAENKYLHSNSSYNFENQAGQTLSDEDPGYALGYATGFAPKEIADRHYKDGQPSYLVEFINSPDLSMTKNDVQESYTYSDIDQQYITRIFEITYDPETKKDMVQDITGSDFVKSAFPELGKGLADLAHGKPEFYRDKETGTILYAVQDEEGNEDGRYISEKNPGMTFTLDGLKEPIMSKHAPQLLGVSGDVANIERMVVGKDGKLHPSNDDIRYSSAPKSVAELQEENRELREKLDALQGAERRAEYWQGQTRRTEAPTLRQGDVDKLARNIAKGYSSTIDASDISGRMKSLGEYILQGGDETGDLNYETAKERAVDIARDVVHNAKALNEGEYSDLYRDIRSSTKGGVKITPAESEQIADFNEWRKANFGKLHVGFNEGTPVDALYQELADKAPWLFPADIVGAGEQLEQIVNAIDTLKPVYENPHSLNMAEAVEYCANDIIDGLIDESVRQTPPTFADRQAAKLDAAKAEGRERLERLRAEKNARIEQIKEQGRKRTEDAVRRERAKRDEQIAALKEHYAEARRERAERRADSAARTRLLNIVKRLRNRKLPAVNRALLDQYIGDIDTVSKGITGEKIEQLSALEDWYLDRKKNDPDFISDPQIEETLRRLHKRHISDLSAEEVADLTEVLLNIENELRTERKLIDSADRRDTYVQGVESIGNIQNSKGSKGGKIDRMFTTELLSPEREMHRVTGYADDDPLYRLSKDISAGQRKMFDYKRRAEALFTKWTNDKKLTRRIAGKKADNIKIAGLGENGITEVEITPAMRMSLYLHSLSDQNLRHIAGGGITVPDAKLYRKGDIAEAYARGTTIKLLPSQIRSITAQMTMEEKAFAEAARSYFNGMSREAINEISEKLKGYSLADVENYFPINTDSNFTKKEFEALKFDGTIEGMGFLKERINASNPIMLRDLNSVLSQSIDQHARYYGLAVPVRNFNKVYGVTKASFDEAGNRNGYESSVQQAIGKKWGKAANKYIEKMMADLQNPPQSQGSWSEGLAKVRSNYARSVLELNGSVAIKQSASYPTAAAVVGWGPLIKAAPYMMPGVKVNKDLVERYTPLLWYRSQGYSNQELGDITKSGRSLPRLLNWIQGIDIKTTSALWKAAEYYVRSNNRSVERGTDAYYKAVADVYNRIIEETQPNYTAMQRPQLLRSDSDLVRTLNMFKTQPFQNFNILYDAIGNLNAKRADYRNSGTQESKQAFKDAKKNAANAISSQITSAFVFSLMQFAWDVFLGRTKKYKDDDDELTWESWLKGMGFNMVSSGFGMVPFGTELLELGEATTDGILKKLDKEPIFDQKWYGVDVTVTEAINNLAEDAMTAAIQTTGIIQKTIIGDSVTEADWESYGRTMYNSINSLAQLGGVPLDNVRKLATAIAQNTFKAAEGKYVGGYDALRITSDPSKYSSDYYDLLYDAYTHDQSAYKEIYKKMIQSGRFTDDKIKTAMEKRMKDAQGVGSVNDLSARYMAPAEQAQYDAGIRKMQSSSVWQEATAEQRNKATDILQGLVTGSNDQTVKTAREKIEGGKSVGLDETEYLLYKVALMIADANNADPEKRNGTTDQAESAAAVEMLNGLSQDEKAYLWASPNISWTTSKNNPYGTVSTVMGNSTQADVSGSTMFSAAKYDPSTKTVTLTFRDSGMTYTYKNIPQSEWDAFNNASSKGSYFNSHWR